MSGPRYTLRWMMGQGLSGMVAQSAQEPAFPAVGCATLLGLVVVNRYAFTTVLAAGQGEGELFVSVMVLAVEVVAAIFLWAQYRARLQSRGLSPELVALAGGLRDAPLPVRELLDPAVEDYIEVFQLLNSIVKQHPDATTGAQQAADAATQAMQLLLMRAGSLAGVSAETAAANLEPLRRLADELSRAHRDTQQVWIQLAGVGPVTDWNAVFEALRHFADRVHAEASL